MFTKVEGKEDEINGFSVLTVVISGRLASATSGRKVQYARMIINMRAYCNNFDSNTVLVYCLYAFGICKSLQSTESIRETYASALLR